MAELEQLEFMVGELVVALSRLGVHSSIDFEIAAGKIVEYFASVGTQVAITINACVSTQKPRQKAPLENSSKLMMTTSSSIVSEMDDVEVARSLHRSLLAGPVAVLLLLENVFF